MDDVIHLVSFSGGMGSFAEAKLCCEEFGIENVKLLFADTQMEDEDLYRFLYECVVYLGCDFERISEGRTPFQVYKDHNFMSNSRVDHCSAELKRNLLIKKIRGDYKPEDVHVHIGIDYSECHRLERMQKYVKPYIYRSLLVEKGLIVSKSISERFGIKRPRLYEWGLGHNNCGGFCCKAGLGHYAALYKANPKRYLKFEAEEQAVYDHMGKTYPFLVKQENNNVLRITLREYRVNYLEKKAVTELELQEFGGCGCAI